MQSADWLSRSRHLPTKPQHGALFFEWVPGVLSSSKPTHSGSQVETRGIPWGIGILPFLCIARCPLLFPHFVIGSSLFCISVIRKPSTAVFFLCILNNSVNPLFSLPEKRQTPSPKPPALRAVVIALVQQKRRRFLLLLLRPSFFLRSSVHSAV